MFRCAPALPVPVIYWAQIGVGNYFPRDRFPYCARVGETLLKMFWKSAQRGRDSGDEINSKYVVWVNLAAGLSSE